MNPIDVFMSTLSALSTVTSKFHGVEKNVVDDIVLEIVQKKVPDGQKANSGEIKKILDGLRVNKLHIPGYKRIKIRYETE